MPLIHEANIKTMGIHTVLRKPVINNELLKAIKNAPGEVNPG